MTEDQFELYSHVASLVDYDPFEGTMVWRHRKDNEGFNARFAGANVGSPNDRGIIKACVQFDGSGKIIPIGRLAYFMLYGDLPRVVIFKDRDQRNFKADNLEARDSRRVYTASPNTQNTTGRTGVYTRPDRGTYMAKIDVRGQSIFLGSFETMDEAIAAREAAEIKFNIKESQ